MTIRDRDKTKTIGGIPIPRIPEERDALTPQCLVELYADDVWRFVSSKLRSREDAEDAAMEVFASAVRDFPRLSKAESPRLWLLAVARNKVHDLLRRRYRRSESPLQEALSVPVDDASNRHDLIEALDGMPDLHREVLVLKYVNGLSTEEVAKVIRKSPQAANSLLQRARQALRERAQPLIDAHGGQA